MVTTTTQDEIDLSWTDNASNETGFEIERATFSAGPWEKVGETAANVTAFASTGLSPGTTYYHRVRATGAGGALSGYTSPAITNTPGTAPGGGGGGGDGGGGVGGSGNFAVEFVGGPPASALGGSKGLLSVRVTNTGQSAVSGARVTLFASGDNTLSGDDTAIVASSKPLRLKPGKSKTIKLRFNYPGSSDPVYLLARAGTGTDVTTPTAGAGDTVTASSSTVAVEAATVQLTPTSITPSGKTITGGQKVSATLVVSNAGNVPYKGTLSAVLSLSTDPTAGNSDDGPLAATSKRISIKPGASKRIRLSATLPVGLQAGSTYYLVGSVSGSPVTGVTVNGGSVAATSPVTVVA